MSFLLRSRARLRRKSAWWLYGDSRHSPHGRRRLRRRWLGALLSLALVLGVIVFAAEAFGHEPFVTASSTPAAATTAGGASLTSFELFAAEGGFSTWRRTSNLGRAEQETTVEGLAGELAQAFVDGSAGQIPRSSVPRLQASFETLLTASGVDALGAASDLLATGSTLTQIQRQALAKGLDAVIGGFSTELGNQAADGLVGAFHRFGGSEAQRQQPVVVHVYVQLDGRTGPAPPVTSAVKVTLVRPPELPSAFIWFDRTWGRADADAFERLVRSKHAGGDARQALATLLICHPTVRKVLRIAPLRPGYPPSRCQA